MDNYAVLRFDLDQGLKQIISDPNGNVWDEININDK